MTILYFNGKLAHGGGEWVKGDGKDNLAIHMYVLNKKIHDLFERDEKSHYFNDSTQPVKLYKFNQTNGLGIPTDEIKVT